MMAADYNLDSLQKILDPVKGWKISEETSGNEYVLEFPLSTTPHVKVMVYSSITKTGNEMRDKGRDAIRVFALDTKKKRPLTKCRRVYRTPGWRDNLKSLVLETFNLAKERR